MNHHNYMKIALIEANKAAKKDEVPVGAVIVDPRTGEVIAKTHNQSEHVKDATAHAEIEAMKKACKKLKQNRLRDMVLYVTLEPCTMCAAAISMMRIAKVYFGAEDKKGGAVKNGVCFYNAPTCHHIVEFEGGIMEEECSTILKSFFRDKRIKNI